MNKKVLFRIAAEFWFPFTAAILWTLYSAMTTVTLGLKDIINIFGPSFFLLSWATGQFFRVKKQVGTDQNFEAIEARVVAVLDKLESHTKDFMGFTTGKDSYVSFLTLIQGKNTLNLALFNKTIYPTFDITCELLDLDEPIDVEKGILWTRQPFSLASLYPSRAIMGAYMIDLTDLQKLSLNIFIRTRAAGALQQIRLVRDGDWWTIASRLQVDGKTVEQSVPDGFPGWNPDTPHTLFN